MTLLSNRERLQDTSAALAQLEKAIAQGDPKNPSKSLILMGDGLRNRQKELEQARTPMLKVTIEVSDEQLAEMKILVDWLNSKGKNWTVEEYAQTCADLGFSERLAKRLTQECRPETSTTCETLLSDLDSVL